MGCSTSLGKMILFIFNIVFFLLGIASLGVGIWVAVSRDQLFKFVNLIDSRVTNSDNAADIRALANQHGLVEVAGFVLIGLGVFTLLVGFCGCCGAVKESKCLLFIYAILVSVVLAAEVTVAILAAVFQTRFRQQAESGMMKLQDAHFVSVTDFVANKDSASGIVTNLLNYVHVAFSCCGAQTVGDIANSSKWLESNRTWLNAKQLLRPVTCCSMRDTSVVLSPTFDWAAVTDQLTDADCPFTANATHTMHSKTCYQGVMDFVASYAAPLVGVCVGIAVFELSLLLVACNLMLLLRSKSIESPSRYKFAALQHLN